MRSVDLMGQRFGLLVVAGVAPARVRGEGTRWLARCDCGASVEVLGKSLRRGDSRSCGCQRQEGARRARTSHGESVGGRVSPEYGALLKAIERCTDTKNKDYPRYGGRGISVCEEWRGPNGASAFIAHVGRKPSPAHTIERISGDGNYEPGNVRWATRLEQSRNRERVKLSAESAAEIRTKMAAGAVQKDVARDYGLARSTVRRVCLGLTWVP